MRNTFKSGAAAAIFTSLTSLTSLTAIITMTACSTTPGSGASSATAVYIGNSASKEIYVMRMDPGNGDLSLVEKVPVALAGGSLPLAVSPDRRVLYAALRSQPFSAESFAIDRASGKLTKIGSAPLPHSMAYVATDRSGKYLFGASYPGALVSVSPIDATGAAQAAHQVLPTDPNAHSVVTDPTNKYVFVAALGGDSVLQYRFDAATGKLSPNSPASVKTKEKAGPRHLVFHPNGKFVYLLNELDGTVNVFGYQASNGTLSPQQVVGALPAGFKEKIWAADIHFTPDGKFMYTTERTSSTIVGFKVDASNGSLTQIGSYPTEKQPRTFAIDPAGRFLLAAGQLSNSLTTYAIDGATGQLAKLKQYPMGQDPNWIEIVTLP